MKRPLYLLLALCLTLCACTATGQTDEQSTAQVTAQSTSQTTAQTSASTDGLLSDKDVTLADASQATDIVLTGESVVISQAGTYRLTGEITNGSIFVNPATEDMVWLLLDGVTVHNESGAALVSDGADKLILTLAEGSVNTFSQGASTPLTEDNDAAIFSRDDLTVNGTGALVVESQYLDGINCRDSLRIVSGTITVTAVDDGMVGKDEVTICGGDITVIAQGGDAIKATNDTDAERGFVALAGGAVSVVTGGGAASAQRTSAGGWGGWYEAESTDTTASQKGLKAETYITISGGALVADTVDDAVHANGDIAISGGQLTLQSGDDGVHSDGTLTLSGGAIDVQTSYEGLEATNIIISGGDIRVISTDDGINGAGGDSATTTESGGWGGQMGRFGRDMFSSSTGEMTLSGGRVYIQADGDGVDVNGSVTMTGGELYVRGSENSANGALDYDGSFTLTGGTLLAAGASGMAQSVSSSTVPGVTFTTGGASGDLAVADASGNVLVSCSFTGSFNHVVLYSDLFAEGQSYDITIGDASGTLEMSTATQSSSGGGGRR